MEADGILSALLPSTDAERHGLRWAIRRELVVLALEDPRRPRTLVELVRVFEGFSAGETTGELLATLRDREQREPGLTLAELLRRSR